MGALVSAPSLLGSRAGVTASAGRHPPPPPSVPSLPALGLLQPIITRSTGFMGSRRWGTRRQEEVP